MTALPLLLRQRRIWLGLGVTACFLLLLVVFTNLSQMGRALRDANYLYVAPAVAVYFAGVWLRAVRWSWIMLPVKRTAVRSLFPVVVIGFMANNALPLRLGEVVRSYVVGERQHISKTAAFGTIAVDRLFDGLALLLFVSFALVVIPDSEWRADPAVRDVTRVTAILFTTVLALFLGLAFYPRGAHALAFAILGGAVRMTGLLPLAPLRRQLLKFEATLEGLAGLFLSGLSVLKSPRRVLAALALSVIIWLSEASMFWIVLQGFDFRVGFEVIILATATANLITTVPSSQGGVGPFEGALVGTLVLFGVGNGEALAFALVLHAALLLPVTILGLLFLWSSGLSLRDALRRGQPPARDRALPPVGYAVGGVVLGAEGARGEHGES